MTAPTPQGLSAAFHWSWHAQSLARHEPPPAETEPGGSWIHRYTLRELQYESPVGEVTMERRSGPRVALRIRTQRNAVQGHSYYTDCVCGCGDDLLSSMTEWRVEAKVAESPEGPPFPHSSLSKEGRVSGNKMVIRTGADKRHLRLSAPPVHKWALLHTVQRLPADLGSAEPFVLVDEFDEIHPDNWLRPAGCERVRLKGGEQTLRVFLQTGPGLPPTSFWTDEHGRVVVAISGVQLVTLDSATPL